MNTSPNGIIYGLSTNEHYMFVCKPKYDLHCFDGKFLYEFMQPT